LRTARNWWRHLGPTLQGANVSALISLRQLPWPQRVPAARRAARLRRAACLHVRRPWPPHSPRGLDLPPFPARSQGPI